MYFFELGMVIKHQTDNQMNKGSSKHKNSGRATKSSRNMTSKYSCITNTPTPQSKHPTGNSRRRNLQKFKSIPTITYREQQNTDIAHNHFIYQSYTTHQAEMAHSQIPQARLLYSVSDRNHSPHHKSSRCKPIKSQKKTQVNSKEKTISTMKTQRTITGMQQVLERTKLVLKSYKQKQENWKKEKQCLLKELQKYKPNKKKRKSSVIGQKNQKAFPY